MKLTDLDAYFLKYHDDAHFSRVETLAEADGVGFLCPACFIKNGGKVGTHSQLCWFRGHVPDSAHPGPGRWTPSGTGLNDLTFVAGDPPMAFSLGMQPCFHGYIENGEVNIR